MRICLKNHWLFLSTRDFDLHFVPSDVIVQSSDITNLLIPSITVFPQKNLISVG
ncbi:uncharacterized protein METZ01_LOCUS327893 [marine metagenome]|uniref:Uncharacterized protein n=1 Tax=marine metagenome TaxID=408172 RepID=A0A382PNV0_9ZZZZ